MTRIPLANLTERQVAQLLRALSLGKYAEAALNVPLRGRDLMHCVEEDLVQIGISFRPHRRSLLEEIEHFKEGGVPGDMLIESGRQDANVTSSAGDTLRQIPEAAACDADSEATTTMSSWLAKAEAKLNATPLPEEAAPASLDGEESVDVAAERLAAATLASEAPKQPQPLKPPPLGKTPKQPKHRGEGSHAASDRTLAGEAQLPSELDLIAAKLGGLALRSEVGEAVRAVHSGKPERDKVDKVLQDAWKWKPRDPPLETDVRDDVSTL